MRYALPLITALSFVSIASAQNTPPTLVQIAQHEVQRYTALLTLTSAQQEQATTIFTSKATAEASLHATEHTDREALNTAIKSGNTATIQTVAAELGTLEGSMTADRALAQAALYQILTEEQQTRFAAIEDQPGGMGGMGPGQPPPR